MTRAQTVLWRGLYLPGAEYCNLVHSDQEVNLEGTALRMAGLDAAVREVSSRAQYSREFERHLYALTGLGYVRIPL